MGIIPLIIFIAIGMILIITMLTVNAKEKRKKGSSTKA